MFDVAAPLMTALQQARTDLSLAASQVARSQTPYGSARTDSTMAALARHAIFSQALLSAMHARLAELKSVTHG